MATDLNEDHKSSTTRVHNGTVLVLDSETTSALACLLSDLHTILQAPMPPNYYRALLKLRSEAFGQ